MAFTGTEGVIENGKVRLRQRVCLAENTRGDEKGRGPTPSRPPGPGTLNRISYQSVPYTTCSSGHYTDCSIPCSSVTVGCQPSSLRAEALGKAGEGYRPPSHLTSSRPAARSRSRKTPGLRTGRP